ncbi:MAG: pyridoxamine 5'-phosphate oxidase family protein [Robiginitomaculum sp.]|nr:pyridoxamine 5'-phosphate oxidase family protein [Robiginitomaculum sp.]
MISDDPRSGIDVSHRGGRPGFVKVHENGMLTFPDFKGNRFFNTLGNIVQDPRIGLFFPDFETGNVVFLTGRAEIIWDDTRIHGFTGAERLIDIVPEEIVFAPGIIPLKGTFIDEWPMLAATGVW